MQLSDCIGGRSLLGTRSLERKPEETERSRDYLYSRDLVNLSARYELHPGVSFQCTSLTQDADLDSVSSIPLDNHYIIRGYLLVLVLDRLPASSSSQVQTGLFED